MFLYCMTDMRALLITSRVRYSVQSPCSCPATAGARYVVWDGLKHVQVVCTSNAHCFNRPFLPTTLRLNVLVHTSKRALLPPPPFPTCCALYFNRPSSLLRCSCMHSYILQSALYFHRPPLPTYCFACTHSCAHSDDSEGDPPPIYSSCTLVVFFLGSHLSCFHPFLPTTDVSAD